MNADDQAWYVKYFLRFLFPPLFQLCGLSHCLYDGALPAIKALVSDDAKPGVCYAPGHSNEMTGDPIPHRRKELQSSVGIGMNLIPAGSRCVTLRDSDAVLMDFILSHDDGRIYGKYVS